MIKEERKSVEEITRETYGIAISAGELGLIHRINSLSQHVTELIVVDRVNGAVYQRNFDWEWAGGSLYDVIGHLRPELIQVKGLLDEKVHVHEDFWEKIKDCYWTRQGIIM